jgi:opacity protein-like surface antigen
MKKSTALLLAAIITTVFFSKEANAQFSAGVNLGMIDLDDIDAHLGFNVAGKYNLSDKVRIGLNIGYYSKSTSIFGEKLTSFIQPITGLVEYSFSTKPFSPHAGVDIGIYRFGFSGGGESESDAYFGFAPLLGFNYSVSEKVAINANFKYHVIRFEEDITNSGIGLNGGVAFKF